MAAKIIHPTIDLTASDSETTPEIDPKLEDAIITATPDSLRTAMIEICKRMPSASNIISPLLIASSPLLPSSPPAPPSVQGHKAVRTSCSSRMTFANRAARKSAPSTGGVNRLLSKDKEDDEPWMKRKRKRVCEYCNEDPNANDGCCKQRRMQRARRQDAKDVLDLNSSSDARSDENDKSSASNSDSCPGPVTSTSAPPRPTRGHRPVRRPFQILAATKAARKSAPTMSSDPTLRR